MTIMYIPYQNPKKPPKERGSEIRVTITLNNAVKNPIANHPYNRNLTLDSA